MEEKLNFKEFNQKAFDAFVNTDICAYVQQIIRDFYNFSRSTTKEEQLVKSVLADFTNHDRIAFAYATSDSHQTIQSAIGTIASAILAGDKELDSVQDAHQVASELIFFASNYIPNDVYPNNMYEMYITVNGYLKCKPLYRIEESKEYYPLPNFEPTTIHRPLGAYKWEITEKTALDIMNQTAFTILDLDLEEPNKDLKEKHSIWQVRKATMPHMVGKPIYFNWHPDYRGRVYDAGYHYHIQSDEFAKNMIAFNESEYITQEGIDSIKCAIASAFGQDKEIDEVKLKWYADNEDTLDYKTAKEPYTAMVQMISLQSAIENGYTNIPVEKDASCSQRQIVAVLTKCKTTASACNIYNPENNEIQDAYKLVANEMSRLLEELLGE